MQLTSTVSVERDTRARAARPAGPRTVSTAEESEGRGGISPLDGGLIGLMVVLLAGCANPVPPSGGPRDAIPPSIVQTRPVRDTVNVTTDTRVLRIEFSEYVERSSLPRALSVTPPFESRPQFDWSGRSVEIEFPEPLRDSTTYIFALDTNLSDAHGVSLENPVRIAFSTGPKINRGQIQGRVLGGWSGRPKKRVDIYAYALSPTAIGAPRPLPAEPAYRTQTGEEGRFTLNYMREQPYYVVALRDNNRNRRPDRSESFAVPPRFALRADSGATEVSVPWLLGRTDTIAPTLGRIQPLSRQRFRVHFSEPIRLRTRAPEAWVLRDSTTGERVTVRTVYADPDRSRAVQVRTAPMRNVRHILTLRRGVVTDTVGQRLPPDTARFRAATRPDTTRARFQEFLPSGLAPDTAGAYPLLPDVSPGVRFNQPPGPAALRRGLSVRDTTGQSRAFSVSTGEGTTYQLQFESPLAPGQVVDVIVAGEVLTPSDTTYRRRFRRVTRRVLGRLSGTAVVADTTWGPAPQRDTTTLRIPAPLTNRGVADTLTVPSSDPTAAPPSGRRDLLDSLFYEGPLVVELTAVESSPPVQPRRRTLSPGSTFVFEDLPEGRFRFRAFLDRDENGRWNPGTIVPYVPAEPVTWTLDPVTVRPRWTTELPAPLRLPLLAPVPTQRKDDSTSAPTPGANR